MKLRDAAADGRQGGGGAARALKITEKLLEIGRGYDTCIRGHRMQHHGLKQHGEPDSTSEYQIAVVKLSFGHLVIGVLHDVVKADFDVGGGTKKGPVRMK